MADLVLPIRAIAVASLASYRAVRNKSRAMAVDLMDFTIPETVLLHTIFPHAQSVTARVREHVLDRPEDARQAWMTRESYAINLSMIAVAGAIVAQIAITALSLPHTERTHWTASASFIISLVAGLLSVYFACMVQVKLGGLHGASEVRRWLITQRTGRLHLLPYLARRHRAHLEHEAITMQSRLKRVLTQEEGEAPSELAGLMLELHTQHIPSLYSALLLVAPMQLLNWSPSSLLVGVGIYYGLIFTNGLGDMQGANANLALLLVYTLFTATALASFVGPDKLKLTETDDWANQNHSRLDELIHQTAHPHGNSRVSSSSPPPTGPPPPPPPPPPPANHQAQEVSTQNAASNPANIPTDNGTTPTNGSESQPTTTKRRDEGGDPRAAAVGPFRAGGHGR